MNFFLLVNQLFSFSIKGILWSFRHLVALWSCVLFISWVTHYTVLPLLIPLINRCWLQVN